MVSWQRNLFAVTAASFIGFTGFTLVMPFLPLYFQLLGVGDLGEIAMWSGLSLGVTPAVTAMLAPVWGRLADRYGRKIMVERSLISFVIVMASMAFVTRAWHVFALRAVQGLFAGYGALTLTMAADSAQHQGVYAPGQYRRGNQPGQGLEGLARHAQGEYRRPFEQRHLPPRPAREHPQHAQAQPGRKEPVEVGTGEQRHPGQRIKHQQERFRSTRGLPMRFNVRSFHHRASRWVHAASQYCPAR